MIDFFVKLKLVYVGFLLAFNYWPEYLKLYCVRRACFSAEMWQIYVWSDIFFDLTHFCLQNRITTGAHNYSSCKPGIFFRQVFRRCFWPDKSGAVSFLTSSARLEDGETDDAFLEWIPVTTMDAQRVPGVRFPPIIPQNLKSIWRARSSELTWSHSAVSAT